MCQTKTTKSLYKLHSGIVRLRAISSVDSTHQPPVLTIYRTIINI